MANVLVQHRHALCPVYFELSFLWISSVFFIMLRSIQSQFFFFFTNPQWLNKIDNDWLKELVKDQKKIFVLEDHSAVGGLGDRILNALVETNSIAGKEYF